MALYLSNPRRPSFTTSPCEFGFCRGSALCNLRSPNSANIRRFRDCCGCRGPALGNFGRSSVTNTNRLCDCCNGRCDTVLYSLMMLSSVEALCFAISGDCASPSDSAGSMVCSTMRSDMQSPGLTFLMFARRAHTAAHLAALLGPLCLNGHSGRKQAMSKRHGSIERGQLLQKHKTHCACLKRREAGTTSTRPLALSRSLFSLSSLSLFLSFSPALFSISPFLSFPLCPFLSFSLFPIP